MVEADPVRLRNLEGAKWTRYGPTALPAWVADMDFDPAIEIKEAIVEMTMAGDLGYCYEKIDALIPAWGDWLAERNGWRPDPEACVPFTGALHALETAMAINTNPGDGVVIFSPIYAPFRHAIVDSGRRVVDVPLDGPDWRLDAQRFEAALDADTKMVLFCQPHNPLGRVFDHTELAVFADVAVRHGLLVISDEIWADLTLHGNAHVPLWNAAPSLHNQLITLGSASKAFNVAGLRCALAHIGHQFTLDTLATYPGHLIGGPSTLSAQATLAAWTTTGASAWLAEAVDQLQVNVEHLAQRVRDDLPGVTMHIPEATYLAWLDFSSTPLHENPAKHLLKHADLVLEPGQKFGEQYHANARLNFATSPALLDDAIDRIRIALKEPQ